MPLTYNKLATYTATSSVANITFSSISSAYTHLVLNINAQPTSAGQTMFMQFNSTASDYSWQMLNRTTASEARNVTSDTRALLCDYTAGIPTTTWTTAIAHIFGYNSTNYQTTYLVRSGNGSVITDMNVGRWANTAVVNSITIFIGSGGNQLATGTTVTLYGLAKA